MFYMILYLWLKIVYFWLTTRKSCWSIVRFMYCIAFCINCSSFISLFILLMKVSFLTKSCSIKNINLVFICNFLISCYCYLLGLKIRCPLKMPGYEKRIRRTQLLNLVNVVEMICHVSTRSHLFFCKLGGFKVEWRRLDVNIVKTVKIIFAEKKLCELYST